MHPDDANGRKAPADRPFRVLLIAASNRRQYDCPGIDSKARALMFRMADRLPGDWEIDLEDLGNVWNREQIRTCNGCVSTSAALCVWPCNCYKKGSWGQPDLMWNLDLYVRLDLADAWAFISPVNWYGPSSNLKAMFDRLVCMNGGNPRSDLIGHKNPERAIALTHSAQWAELNVNHLEGRTAAFFSYGDGGADEVDDSGRPRILEHRAWFDPATSRLTTCARRWRRWYGNAGTAGFRFPTRCGGMRRWESAGSTATTRRSTWRKNRRPCGSSTNGPTNSSATWPRKERCSPAGIGPSGTALRFMPGTTCGPSGGDFEWR
jgi:hypothetical protein